MNLSISNIAWEQKNDKEVFRILQKNGYNGLEVAPTRLFPQNPYLHIAEAKMWAYEIYHEYGLSIPSLQSIWYGRQEKIFGSTEERKSLLIYTTQAINFAEAIESNNLVFGCPQNRIMPENTDKNTEEAVLDFFWQIGEYAIKHGSVFSIEANPRIYNTNYVNFTADAFALARQVNSLGFKVNLDVGTIIENEEDISQLKGNIQLINHVHISEPRLTPIRERSIHRQLINLLKEENYRFFISIEMGPQKDLMIIENAIRYVKELCR